MCRYGSSHAMLIFLLNDNFFFFLNTPKMCTFVIIMISSVDKNNAQVLCVL